MGKKDPEDYDYETLDVVDNLLPFPAFVEKVKEIAKKNDVPLKDVCVAALDGEICLEARIQVDDDYEEDYEDA